MKLIDLNRDGGIGANSLFVQFGDLSVLIDCGLNPKKTGRAAIPDLAQLRGNRSTLSSSPTATWTTLAACRWPCASTRTRR